jgi:hypothetical protein
MIARRDPAGKIFFLFLWGKPMSPLRRRADPLSFADGDRRFTEKFNRMSGVTASS